MYSLTSLNLCPLVSLPRSCVILPSSLASSSPPPLPLPCKDLFTSSDVLEPSPSFSQELLSCNDRQPASKYSLTLVNTPLVFHPLLYFFSVEVFFIYFISWFFLVRVERDLPFLCVTNAIGCFHDLFSPPQPFFSSFLPKVLLSDTAPRLYSTTPPQPPPLQTPRPPLHRTLRKLQTFSRSRTERRVHEESHRP